MRNINKIEDIVPPDYDKFLPLFSKAKANEVLPHYPYITGYNG
jgi:hypothetical protein